MLFVRHPGLLKRLVAVLLSIRLDSIEQFDIINTEMPPEEIGKKFCRLDITMVVDGTKVNLEIQVEDEGNYPERSLFHWARIYSTALPSGETYSLLPRTIVISILGFKQFDCDQVHSEYQILEVNRHTLLTDKLGLHYFELPKLHGIDSIDMNSEQDLWLALFNAETEEELEKLATGGGVIMSQAIEAYHGITATEEFKYLEYLRSKARHDEAQAIWNAEMRGAEAEREKWQSIAEENERLRRENAELRLQQQ
jgi:predicted transposase/invertase (TIGR01784 family)